MALFVPNILTGGQSNDLGGGQIDDLPSDQQYFGLPFPHVRYLKQINCPVTAATVGQACDIQDDAWAPLAPRSNGVNEFIGPEMTIGRGLWDRGGEQPFTFIKSATNGSSAPEWIDYLLPRALAYVDQYAEGPTKLFTWVHGESATASGALATGYEAQLTEIFLTLRAHFRARWGEDPVISFNLLHVNAYSLDPARAARVPTIRQGQRNVAAALDRCHLVDPDALPLKADSIHYTTSSMLGLGDLLLAPALTYPDLLTVRKPYYYA